VQSRQLGFTLTQPPRLATHLLGEAEFYWVLVSYPNLDPETRPHMFIPTIQDASASTASAINPTPTPTAEPIRHMLFGSLSAVRTTIQILHKRGYADPNDWSQPISTGRPNEVMAILTKRVRRES